MKLFWIASCITLLISTTSFCQQDTADQLPGPAVPTAPVNQTAPALIRGQSPLPPGLANTQSVFGLDSPANSAVTLYPGQQPSPFGRASSAEERQLTRDIMGLLNDIRKNEDDSKETELQDQLKTSLEKLFDARIQPREKEIEQLEKRIEELKSSIDERKQRKDEIVELKLKTLLNEAKGLGF